MLRACVVQEVRCTPREGVLFYKSEGGGVFPGLIEKVAGFRDSLVSAVSESTNAAGSSQGSPEDEDQRNRSRSPRRNVMSSTILDYSAVRLVSIPFSVPIWILL